MAGKLILYLTAIIVILPTTAVALFVSLLAVPYVLAMLMEKNLVAALGVSVILTLAWVGIATLWKLVFHFRKNDVSPPRRHLYVIGLLAGVAVSGYFVLLSGDTLSGWTFFFGWPIFGAAILGGFLFLNSAENIH